MSTQEDQPDRTVEIVKARLAGETLERISERFGLPRQNILQIIQNYEKQAERNKDPFKGLPPKITKLLRRSGINNLAEAQRLSDAELAGIKNMDAKTARQVREWIP